MTDSIPAFTIEGVEPRELAARWGTPLVVYDAKAVRDGYRRAFLGPDRGDMISLRGARQ
jgi:diaminopimelate decarboxylase